MYIEREFCGNNHRRTCIRLTPFFIDSSAIAGAQEKPITKQQQYAAADDDDYGDFKQKEISKQNTMGKPLWAAWMRIDGGSSSSKRASYRTYNKI